MTPKLHEIVIAMIKDGSINRTHNEVFGVFSRHAKANRDLISEAVTYGLLSLINEATETDEVKAYNEERAKNRRLVVSEARTERKKRREAHEDYAKKHGIPVEAVSRHMMQVCTKDIEEKYVKAQQFDHIVSLLDTWNVGGKSLGDCTKSDLLSAAVQDRHTAEILRTNTEVYYAIAGILVGNETVRQSKNRRGVIDALSKRCEDDRT